MEFESPDVAKEFPGLYASESGGKKSESDFSDDSHDKHKRDSLLRSKDKKDSKKDRGYAALEGESSPDEADSEMNPSKSKKKAFKFPSKKEKREKSREKDSREVESVKEKEHKEKKKLEKEAHKTSKLKGLKEKKLKSKHSEESIEIPDEPPIFGVPLEAAVARSRCHDGVKLPLVVRNCIDFVEECGLTVDGIYKSSGNKSRAQQLKKNYNNRVAVSFIDTDPVTVAGLLKLFLRELPETIIPTSVAPEFEEAAGKKGDGMESLIQKMPAVNGELLGWMVLHCKHLVANEKLNKCGGLQGVCGTFAPLLQTSPKILSALICYSATLFPNMHIHKYIPPLSGPTPNIPTTISGCNDELRKLESVLAQVHEEMHAGLAGSRREEQMWDAQRIVTQLKRKLRMLQKPSEPRASDDEKMDFNVKQDEPLSAPVPTTVTEKPQEAAKEEPEEKSEQPECKEGEEPELPAEIPADVSSKSQTIQEDSSSPTTVTETINVSAIVHEVPREETPSPLLPDEDEETREQRSVQEQLETLVDSLLERIEKENSEVGKLREELVKKTEDGWVKPRKTGDSNDMDSMEELQQQNQALQQQRDNLCRLIAEEREAMSRTRAKLNFKLQQQKLLQKATA
ncbi:ralA-binding protein 1 isoform X2 [Neocloeon triangulifer]|uniref:ralA-binding protein 1 isoform X2 n=1 Tax=Neocloeon triangulifer TaxID=2078957 RepID=UPI00286F29F9|nr:ralA-binding protein 1 isoform X2 [Neocloeon triangulifer]